MTNIRYEDGSAMRGPSVFWRDLEPWHGINPSEGWGGFDDFLDMRTTAIHKVVLEEADNNSTWSQAAGEECGAFRLTLATDANEEGSVQWGNTNTAAGVVMDEGYGRAWFEGRIRLSAVTDGLPMMVFGLAEEGFAASNCIVDTTFDIADKDFVGFCIRQDDGNSVDIIYQTSGSAFATHKAEVTTITAATWVKLGMYFDGTNVWFYVDGVKYPTHVAANTTGFPDGEELSPVFALKQVATTGFTADIDWWAFAQEAVVGLNS